MKAKSELMASNSDTMIFIIYENTSYLSTKNPVSSKAPSLKIFAIITMQKDQMEENKIMMEISGWPQGVQMLSGLLNNSRINTTTRWVFSVQNFREGRNSELQ